MRRVCSSGMRSRSVKRSGTARRSSPLSTRLISIATSSSAPRSSHAGRRRAPDRTCWTAVDDDEIVWEIEAASLPIELRYAIVPEDAAERSRFAGVVELESAPMAFRVRGECSVEVVMDWKRLLAYIGPAGVVSGIQPVGALRRGTRSDPDALPGVLE